MQEKSFTKIDIVYIRQRHCIFYSLQKNFPMLVTYLLLCPLSAINQNLNTSMANCIEDLLLPIKSGTQLITEGRHLTQHKRKFNETPKFFVILGFGPALLIPPLPISFLSDGVFKGARAAVATYSNFHLNQCYCIITSKKSALISPKFLWLRTGPHFYLHIEVAFVRNQNYKYFLVLLYSCFIV